MAWTYNNIRVYTQGIVESSKQIIARLQPVSGGTVKQFFGYETVIIKLTAKVVGKSNCDALQALTQTGTAYVLVAPEGSLGSFELSGFSATRDNSINQTIDTTQVCTTPVYTVELELYS